MSATAQEHVHADQHAELHAELRTAFPREVALCALSDRLTWANDASIYRLVPRAVLLPRHGDDVQLALRLCARLGVPVCFRAGGTSLSGQAVSDGVLIVISRWRAIDVLDDGARVRCQPGAVGAWVNSALARFQRRIGPDPASIQAAEMGGIVANNASGMCCGVSENSYQTVCGLDLILADGTRIDTAASDADAQLHRLRPDIAEGLLRLRDRVRGDAALSQRIRSAFAIKNTVGYSINAFLDADTPAAMLHKLVVGSEGTLAFIASATLRTLPVAACKATAWLLFRDVEAAGAAVPALASSGAAAIELLDAVSLRRVQDKLDAPLPDGEPAGILLEYHAADAAALHALITAAAPMLHGLDLCAPAAFSRDPVQQARWWAIRKGLFPSVGAVRAAGTAVVIEDVAYPVARLALAVRSLRRLFDRYGYADAVIFGHAKDGNLHFTLTPDLSRSEEIARYRDFMAALVDDVLAHGGTLKAEHGTGRNMAPFVERQWGADAVAIMRELKRLLDPHHLLNPGVLLSDDPLSHLKHLKTLPSVHPLIDRCIECGFCEPICPSRDAGMSPRQRIAFLRAGGGVAAELQSAWADAGLDHCAADGLCATACPVGIDTGAMVKVERAARHGAWAHWLASLTAQHFSMVTTGARAALHLARASGLRRLPGRAVPLPAPARALPMHWPRAADHAPSVLYVPSCLVRTMGSDDPRASVAHAFAELCTVAGIGVVVPPDHAQLCCGQAFASKGFSQAATLMAQRVAASCAVFPELLIVTDTSTCSAQLAQLTAWLDGQDAVAWQRRRVIDPTRFTHEVLLPRLPAYARDAAVVLHPTCADQKSGTQAALSAITGGRTPAAIGCCGMAGDKGWITPELTAAATQREAAEIRGAACGVTTGSTCAMAMSSATGVDFQHLWIWLAARVRAVQAE